MHLRRRPGFTGAGAGHIPGRYLLSGCKRDLVRVAGWAVARLRRFRKPQSGCRAAATLIVSVLQ